MEEGQEEGAGQRADDQQRGNEELCAQPKVGHFTSINRRTGALDLAARRAIPGNKLISRAMYSEEKPRIGGVRFELLPEAQNVIVHRARGRIVLIAPHFIQTL